MQLDTYLSKFNFQQITTIVCNFFSLSRVNGTTVEHLNYFILMNTHTAVLKHPALVALNVLLFTCIDDLLSQSYFHLCCQGSTCSATCAKDITSLCSPVPGPRLFTYAVDDPQTLHLPTYSSWTCEPLTFMVPLELLALRPHPVLADQSTQNSLAPTYACSELRVYPHIVRRQGGPWCSTRFRHAEQPTSVLFYFPTFIPPRSILIPLFRYLWSCS